MKTGSVWCTSRHWLTLGLLLSGFAAGAAGAATNQAAGEFPFTVQYETGDTEFTPGDAITIKAVRGTKEAFALGETYCVEGTYTLASKDEAELALFVTTAGTHGSSAVDPKQMARVKRGTGSFRLIKKLTEEGYPHLSFYPVPSGSSFGGVYFGEGPWVLRNHDYSYFESRARQKPGKQDFIADQVSLSGPNQVLFKYLGNPVPPPPDMDPAYSKEGLMQAVQKAAGKAGMELQTVRIEDSEFPFLVGVVCKSGEFPKLAEELKQMKAYEYGGSVSSHTYAVFNLVPWRAFPPESMQRVRYRLTLRQQIFCDQLRGE